MTDHRELVITHDHPATTGHLSVRDRLTAAATLLSSLTRDLSEDLINLPPAEAVDVLEHVGDLEKRFGRLRTVIVTQQGHPAPREPSPREACQRDGHTFLSGPPENQPGGTGEMCLAGCLTARYCGAGGVVTYSYGAEGPFDAPDFGSPERAGQESA